MTPFKFLMSSACALVLASTAATAADPLVPVTQIELSPEACNRTIKTMGASMGYSVMPAEKPMLLYVLRVNGVDYNAVCDASTGTVKDVTPKHSQ